MEAPPEGGGVRVLLLRCAAPAGEEGPEQALARRAAAAAAAGTARALAAASARVCTVRVQGDSVAAACEAAAAASARHRPQLLHVAAAADVPSSAAERAMAAADGGVLQLDAGAAADEDLLLDEPLPELPLSAAQLSEVALAAARGAAEAVQAKHAAGAAGGGYAGPCVAMLDCARGSAVADELLQRGACSHAASWPSGRGAASHNATWPTTAPAAVAGAALAALLSALDTGSDAPSPAAAVAAAGSATALLATAAMPTRGVPSGLTPVLHGAPDAPVWQTAQAPAVWPPPQLQLPEGAELPFASASAAFEAARVLSSSVSVEVHALVAERCPAGTFVTAGGGSTRTAAVERLQKARRDREMAHEAAMNKAFTELLLALADLDARSAEHVPPELPADVWPGADMGFESGTDQSKGKACYELLLGSRERIAVVGRPNDAAKLCPEALECALRQTLLASLRTTPRKAVVASAFARAEGGRSTLSARRGIQLGCGAPLRQVRAVVPQWVANVARRLAARRAHTAFAAAGVVAVDGVAVEGHVMGAPQTLLAHEALFGVIKPKDHPAPAAFGAAAKRARKSNEGVVGGQGN